MRSKLLTKFNLVLSAYMMQMWGPVFSNAVKYRISWNYALRCTSLHHVPFDIPID
jgi:hypothetical protein